MKLQLLIIGNKAKFNGVYLHENITYDIYYLKILLQYFIGQYGYCTLIKTMKSAKCSVALKSIKCDC